VLGEVQFHAFLTCALEGGEWSASRPGRFIEREGASGTHLILGWVRSGHGGEEKNSQPLPGPEPLVAQRYTTELSRLLGKGNSNRAQFTWSSS
jgi:hypothetical protein